MQLASLLDENAAHASGAKALMDQFHPSLFAALDEAALLYLLTSNAFVHSQDRPTQIRTVVYLLLWRHFRWAATDICRFRITAARPGDLHVATVAIGASQLHRRVGVHRGLIRSGVTAQAAAALRRSLFRRLPLR